MDVIKILSGRNCPGLSICILSGITQVPVRHGETRLPSGEGSEAGGRGWKTHGCKGMPASSILCDMELLG